MTKEEKNDTIKQLAYEVSKDLPDYCREEMKFYWTRGCDEPTKTYICESIGCTVYVVYYETYMDILGLNEEEQNIFKSAFHEYGEIEQCLNTVWQHPEIHKAILEIINS